MPAVTTCAKYTQSVIFLPMPAVTTCAGYAESYISICARLWRPVPGMWIVIFLPMPGITTCRLCWVCKVLYFYLCQPVPGCDDLCRVCGLLYFYLCQLWRPVLGIQRLYFYLHQLWRVCWLLFFLPMPVVTTCAGYAGCCTWQLA